MVQAHALRELTARLGAPHLEQLLHQRGEQAQLVLHWGCGCTALGAMPVAGEGGELRWSRCAHHAAEEAILA